MRRIALVPTLVATLVAGCVTTQATIPLSGGPADLSPLTGKWEGEYLADGNGRAGFISFTLTAGKDVAEGGVVMMPEGFDHPMLQPDRTLATAPAPRGPEPLTIRFVAVSDGRIVGELSSYRDPDCGCLLATRFTGSLVGPDSIQGTFVSTGGIHHPLGTGRWTVTRVKR